MDDVQIARSICPCLYIWSTPYYVTASLHCQRKKPNVFTCMFRWGLYESSVTLSRPGLVSHTRQVISKILFMIKGCDNNRTWFPTTYWSILCSVKDSFGLPVILVITLIDYRNNNTCPPPSFVISHVYSRDASMLPLLNTNSFTWRPCKGGT